VSREAVALWRIAAVAMILTAACALTIDEPLARWIGSYETVHAWDRGISVLEYAAGIEPWKWTIVSVLAAGSAACLARPAWRHRAPAWLFVAGTYLLTRNLMSWIKLFTGRLRPVEWLGKGGAVWLRDDGFSFPSGHIVLFAGLVIPLAVVAPRAGRPLLAVVAFAMIARVAVDAHFVSDVLGGIALTCACAAVWEPVRRLRFDAPRVTDGTDVRPASR
jgi:membrane-associated phospholipid phosphatase